MDHETLFDKYVFPLICEGVEKQIRDAYGDGDASARLMAAVALMAYTEFMGAVCQNDFSWSRGKGEERFNAFLDRIGPLYKALRESQREHFVYDVFRSGLVHFFFVKGRCTIAMKNNPGRLLVHGESPEEDKVVIKPVECGLLVVDNGGYVFVIEKYFRDFERACCELDAERRGKGWVYSIESAGSGEKKTRDSGGGGSIEWDTGRDGDVVISNSDMTPLTESS